MNKAMQERWEKAFHSPGEKVKLGLDVVCDICDGDWTGSPQSGGLLFGSYAICPDCQDEQLRKIKGFGEEEHIRGFCPPQLSFADFVVTMRGPDASIVVNLWPKADEPKK
jgi:hypothetical protein